MGSGMPDRTTAQRSKRYRDRKKRGYRLVRGARLTKREIEELAARGYAVEPGFSLTAVVEAFVSDSLASDLASVRPQRVSSRCKQ